MNNTLRVNPDSLRSLLSSSSFLNQGDHYEVSMGEIVAADFPNCERFWQHFVVPLTGRVLKYPGPFPPLTEEGMRPRPNVDARLEKLSRIHYSAFANLAYCHLHLAHGSLCGFEDFYSHMGSVCDLIEAFLELAYVVLLDCRGEKCGFTELLSEDDFLAIAKEWYGTSYRLMHEHYFRSGRSQSFRLNIRTNVAREFISTFLGAPKVWKSYVRSAQAIRELRNIIVHDVQVGRIVIDGVVWVPKATAIKNYKSWQEVFMSVRNPTNFRLSPNT